MIIRKSNTSEVSLLLLLLLLLRGDFQPEEEVRVEDEVGSAA
jgi:hypothetical protein